LVRCLDESCALKAAREGKDCGSLAEARLGFGGAETPLKTARRLLYLQQEMIGGRQALRDRMGVGVE